MRREGRGGREEGKKEEREKGNFAWCVHSILRIDSDDGKACGTARAQPISVFIFLLTFTAVFTTSDRTGLSQPRSL